MAGESGSDTLDNAGSPNGGMYSQGMVSQLSSTQGMSGLDLKQEQPRGSISSSITSSQGSGAPRETPGQWSSSGGLALKTSPPVLWNAEADMANRQKWQAGQTVTVQSPSAKQKERSQAEPGGVAATAMSPNSSALSSAVEAAMSNVDKALYDMQNREIERLRAKLEASEREVQRCKDELLKEEARRREIDDKYQILEKKLRSPQAFGTGLPPGVGGLDQRGEVASLQQQLDAVKQEKQMETYKRIEVHAFPRLRIMCVSARACSRVFGGIHLFFSLVLLLFWTFVYVCCRGDLKWLERKGIATTPPH